MRISDWSSDVCSSDLLQLLTAKPVLYAANVEEEAAATGNRFSALVEQRAAETGGICVVVSAAIEAEVAALSDAAEKREFLESLGLEQTGLARVISAGYQLLDLVTFFTVGPKEARAWTARPNSKAPQAAGVIHTDFDYRGIAENPVARSEEHTSELQSLMR